MTTNVPYEDCTEEFLRRQALFSELFKHSLTTPAQQRVDTARAILPAIEKLNDRIRAKLAPGVGDAEAEKIVDILRTEGVLLQHLLNVLHMPQKQEGVPLFRKVSADLKDNASKLRSYPDLAQALMEYDTALYKQIDDQLEGVDYATATSKANGAAMRLAKAANQLSGKRTFISPTPLFGASSPHKSVALTGNTIPGNAVLNNSVVPYTHSMRATTNSPWNSNHMYMGNTGVGNTVGNGTNWVAPANTTAPNAVVVQPVKHKGMSWNKMLWWLAILAIGLALLYYLFRNKKDYGSYFGGSSEATQTTPVVEEIPVETAGATGTFPPLSQSVFRGGSPFITPASKAALLDEEGDLQTGYFGRSPALIDYGRV